MKRFVLSAKAAQDVIQLDLKVPNLTRCGQTYRQSPHFPQMWWTPICPSLDLVALLRKEMVEHPELLTDFALKTTDRGLTSSVAA